MTFSLTFLAEHSPLDRSSPRASLHSRNSRIASGLRRRPWQHRKLRCIAKPAANVVRDTSCSIRTRYKDEIRFAGAPGFALRKSRRRLEPYGWRLASDSFHAHSPSLSSGNTLAVRTGCSGISALDEESLHQRRSCAMVQIQLSSGVGSNEYFGPRYPYR